MNSSTRTLLALPGRYLVDNTTLLTTPEIQLSTFNQSNVRSGGEVPQFFVAHVDKYGQIVAEFDNKIRVGLDDNAF